ncbi:Urea transporter [compost metagenome]
MLIGLLISYALPWSAILPPLIIAAGGLSSMLVHQWLKRGPQQLLPAYTAPFVLLGWAALTMAEPAGAASTGVEANPLFALARGLGQIFLLDQPLAGVLIAIGLLISNRYAAVWALLGSAIGGSVALIGGEATAAYNGLFGFNAALAALAFSQERQRPWLPLLAIVLAIALQPVFSLLPVAGLTAPFILACWLLHAGGRLLRVPASHSRRRLHS